MSRMFARAKFFDSDLSKWDVSRVNNMRRMFLGATSFNGDLSKWDVSRVSDMHSMFLGATVFKRELCTAAWVHSKAKKDSMFEGTSGSISPTVCTISTSSSAFSPQSREDLKPAVDELLGKYVSANEILEEIEKGGGTDAPDSELLPVTTIETKSVLLGGNTPRVRLDQIRGDR